MKWRISGQGYKHLTRFLRFVLFKPAASYMQKLTLLAASIFVTEGLFIYIYFLLFEENHQNRMSRAGEKISATILFFFRKWLLKYKSLAVPNGLTYLWYTGLLQYLKCENSWLFHDCPELAIFMTFWGICCGYNCIFLIYTREHNGKLCTQEYKAHFIVEAVKAFSIWFRYSHYILTSVY